MMVSFGVENGTTFRLTIGRAYCEERVYLTSRFARHPPVARGYTFILSSQCIESFDASKIVHRGRSMESINHLPDAGPFCGAWERSSHCHSTELNNAMSYAATLTQNEATWGDFSGVQTGLTDD